MAGWGYKRSRGFTEADRKSVAEYQLEELESSGMYSEARGELEYGGDLDEAEEELERIMATGKQGGQDLSHKLSHKHGADIFSEIEGERKLKGKKRSAFTAFIRAGEKKATSERHRERMAEALEVVDAHGPGDAFDDENIELVGAGFHSAVNHSSANLRHRRAGENRSYGQRMHGNERVLGSKRSSTPDTARAKALEKAFDFDGE